MADDDEATPENSVYAKLLTVAGAIEDEAAERMMVHGGESEHARALAEWAGTLRVAVAQALQAESEMAQARQRDDAHEQIEGIRTALAPARALYDQSGSPTDPARRAHLLAAYWQMVVDTAGVAEGATISEAREQLRKTTGITVEARDQLAEVTYRARHALAVARDTLGGGKDTPSGLAPEYALRNNLAIVIEVLSTGAYVPGTGLDPIHLDRQASRPDDAPMPEQVPQPRGDGVVFVEGTRGYAEALEDALGRIKAAVAPVVAPSPGTEGLVAAVEVMARRLSGPDEHEGLRATIETVRELLEVPGEISLVTHVRALAAYKRAMEALPQYVPAPEPEEPSQAQEETAVQVLGALLDAVREQLQGAPVTYTSAHLPRMAAELRAKAWTDGNWIAGLAQELLDDPNAPREDVLSAVRKAIESRDRNARTVEQRHATLARALGTNPSTPWPTMLGDVELGRTRGALLREALSLSTDASIDEVISEVRFIRSRLTERAEQQPPGPSRFVEPIRPPVFAAEFAELRSLLGGDRMTMFDADVIVRAREVITEAMARTESMVSLLGLEPGSSWADVVAALEAREHASAPSRDAARMAEQERNALVRIRSLVEPYLPTVADTEDSTSYIVEGVRAACIKAKASVPVTTEGQQWTWGGVAQVIDALGLGGVQGGRISASHAAEAVRELRRRQWTPSPSWQDMADALGLAQESGPWNGPTLVARARQLRELAARAERQREGGPGPDYAANPLVLSPGDAVSVRIPVNDTRSVVKGAVVGLDDQGYVEVTTHDSWGTGEDVREAFAEEIEDVESSLSVYDSEVRRLAAEARSWSSDLLVEGQAARVAVSVARRLGDLSRAYGPDSLGEAVTAP